MSKKNLILGSILILLLIMAYLYQGPFKNWKNNLGKPTNILASIKIDNVNKIEIINQKNSLTIEKQSDKWNITSSKNFAADQKTVEDFISKFKNISEVEFEVISDNKNNKKDYLTDRSGIEIKLIKDNKNVGNFIVGKSSIDGNYVSLPDFDKTYLYKFDLLSLLGDTDLWYDKIIFSSQNDKIERIRFQYPDSEFSIENNKGKWEGILPFKFNVNEKKLSKILDIMSNLSASSVPEQNLKISGLDKHLIIIQATGIGVNNILMVGDKNSSGNYYAKKGDSDNLYLITKEQRDELLKRINDFR